MHNVINNFNEWIWNVNNILIVWRKTKFPEQKKYWDFFLIIVVNVLCEIPNLIYTLLLNCIINIFNQTLFIYLNLPII